jgi:hypothetical protein
MIKILDILTNQPVSGAYIFQGEKNAPTFSTFTDSNGEAVVMNPGVYAVSHIAYKPGTIEYTGQGLTAYLEPATYTLPAVTIRPEPEPLAPKPAGVSWIIIVVIALLTLE